MAIKAGTILHLANSFVIDRIQTAGAGNVDIPEEKIYELGNAQTIATVYDTPNLSFDMESLDVSTEIESVLTGETPSLTLDGAVLDFDEAMPVDICSPFKTGLTNFATTRGVVVPYLTLENVTYRFGLRANSTQSYTLRGDAIYYVPGTPFFQEFTLVNNTLSYNFTHTALPYMEGGDTLYALSACVKNPTTKAYRRLFFGTDYTNTSSAITTLSDWFDEGYTKLHVTYGTATVVTYDQTVHQDTSVKPAAVRSKDLEVYVEDLRLATPSLVEWSGVQSFEVSRRVNLDPDEEFGNAHYVAQDYDTAEVTGTITLRPVDAPDLWDKVSQITNVPTNEIIGPLTNEPVEVELRVKDPDTGDVLKTLYVSDAQFTVPSLQGRVQTKLEVTLNFSSASGSLDVYRGER